MKLLLYSMLSLGFMGKGYYMTVAHPQPALSSAVHEEVPMNWGEHLPDLILLGIVFLVCSVGVGFIHQYLRKDIPLWIWPKGVKDIL